MRHYFFKALAVICVAVLSFTTVPATSVSAVECDVTVNAGVSIQQVVFAEDPGTVICIKPGTYHETIRMTKPGQTLRAADPSNQPVIDGKLTLPNSTTGTVNNLDFNHDALISVEAENITIQDIIVTRSKGRAIRVYSPSRSTENVKIIGVTMSRSRADGLAIFGPLYGTGGSSVKGTLIKDSIVEYNNAKQEPGGIGGAGLVVKGAEDVTIDGTYIRYNWGEGLLVDSNWNKSSGLVIINNVVHDNKAAHVYLHAVQNVEMRNNLVYSSYRPDMNRGAVWGCVWIQGLEIESATSLRKRNLPIHGSKNIVIENNLFAGCTNSVTMGAQDPESAIENITIEHNTFVNLGHKNGLLNTDRKFFDVLVGVGGGALRNIAIKYNIFVHEGSYNQQNVSPNPLPNSFTFSRNLWSVKPSGGAYTSDTQIAGKLLQSSFAPLEPKPSNLPAYYEKLRKQFIPTQNSQALNGAVGSTLQKDYFGTQRTGTPDIGAIESPSDQEEPPPEPEEPEPEPEEPPPEPEESPIFSKFDIFPVGNPDGTVNTEDLQLFITEFSRSTPASTTDFDQNGTVDIFDYNALLMEL